MATPDQMEIDAIDSLLGEEEPRRKPRIEQPAPVVQEAPPVGGLSTGPYAAFSREPSAGMETSVDVGSRGGAMTQPVGAPRPVESPLGASGVFDPEDRLPDPTPLVPSDQSAPPAPRPAPQATTGSSAGMDTGVRSTGARAAGDTASAGNPQEAYNNFTGMVDPNASQGDMESAIEASFGHLPGYGGAYKESVMLNGVWYDLVGGYGGPNATFHGLMAKKGGGKGAFGAGLFPEGGGVPQIDNTSRLDQILASIDAMARGEGGPLVNQSIDELLGQAGGGTATGASRTPMVDQSPMRVPGRRVGFPQGA